MLKPKKILEDLPVYQTDEYFEFYKLKLDANENLFGPSDKVLQRFKKLDTKNFNFYPCYGELLDEIAKLRGLEKDNIILTNGCDEAINSVFKTYLEPGDIVLSYAPTFTMPKLYASAQGARFIEIKYEDKWKFNLERMVYLVNGKTKALYLTSPNSPTGDMVSIADIQYLCKKYPNKMVVVDATYLNYAQSEDFNYWNLINLYPNLFVLKSFSKDYALAGLRLGYIASNKNNIMQLKKVISPYTVNSLAVLAGIEAIKDKAHLEKVKQETRKSKEFLYKEFEKLGFKPFKGEGNFMLCDFGEKSSFLYKKLLINSIKVKDMSQLEDLENCLRMTIPPIEDAKFLIETLKPRNLLIFDLDGVIFDVRNSYRCAIEKTFEHFAYKKLQDNEIQDAKNLGGLNCDWDLTEFLLQKHGIEIEKARIIEIFQRYFFNTQNGTSKGLIDNEKLLIDKLNILKLAQKHDLAIFTGRPREEAYYSLEKFGILKHFNIIIAKEDLPKNRQKPYPNGLEVIKRNSVYKEIFYFGDTGDDMICAKAANVNAVGVLPPQEHQSTKYKKYLIDKGALWVLNNINDILKEEK